MSQRTLFKLFVATTTLLSVACSSSQDVLQSAEPNPFTCRSAFVVLPIDYSGLRVGEKSEGEYLAAKRDEKRERWEGDKLAIERAFQRELLAYGAEHGIRVDLAPVATDSHRFVIRPSVHFVEPGFFGGPAMHASEVRMVVDITTPDGRTLDRIVLGNETMGSVAHASVRQRFERDGEELGEATAEYLRGRVAVGAGSLRASDGGCRYASR
jgi:hypothetical protein